MSHTITWVQKQTKCEVLESETVSGLKKTTNGDFESRVSRSRRSCTESKTLLNGNAGRMEDLLVFGVSDNDEETPRTVSQRVMG